MKYSAGLTRMTVISTIGKVSKGGRGEREPEARRKLFKTRERRGRRIDCLTSPQLAGRDANSMHCAGCHQVTSAGYQMSRTFKRHEGTVHCVPSHAVLGDFLPRFGGITRAASAQISSEPSPLLLATEISVDSQQPQARARKLANFGMCIS